MKDKILYDILIPAVKLGIFTALIDAITYMMWGEHINKDVIFGKPRTPRRINYSDYYRRRTDDEF